LDAYTFWQDESVVPEGTAIDRFEEAMRGYKRLRGYPKEEDGECMIFIEFTSVGSYENHFLSTTRIALNFLLNQDLNHPIPSDQSCRGHPSPGNLSTNLLDSIFSKANLSFWFARLLGISRPARCAPTVAGLIRT
jgi:hypothetical protein